MWWRRPVICNLGSGGRDQSLATEVIKASMGPHETLSHPKSPTPSPKKE